MSLASEIKNSKRYFKICGQSPAQIVKLVEFCERYIVGGFDDKF